MTAPDRPDLVAELDRLAAAALGQPSAPFGPVPTGGDAKTVQSHLSAARKVARVDQMPAGRVRLRPLKRAVILAGRPFLRRQAAFNKAVQQAVDKLNGQVGFLRTSVGNELSRVDAVTLALEASIENLAQHLEALERRVGSDQDELREMSSRVAAVRVASGTVRADVDRLLGDLRRTIPPTVEETTVRELAQGADRRVDAFYERFEDAMRGSRAHVRATLIPYLDDLRERREMVGGLVLDVGCGRGEWLQLLADAGLPARGVDTNETATADCLEQGLDVVLGDALAHLRDIPEDSLLAVTGFHLVEHLPVDFQRELAQAALRALRPGGLLILETPNPTNLNVGAASFWLDPTHVRPVHPAYLSFLFSDVGYVDVETRYLHPRDDYRASPEGAGSLQDELMRALRGAQDYAVLGVKPGPE